MAMSEANHIILTAGGHAFGDGAHPTTRMVLAAMGALDPETFAPQNLCDMGCGSGLLSLRAIQLFGCHVVAVDMERSSVEATRANAIANGVRVIDTRAAARASHEPAELREGEHRTCETEAPSLLPIHSDGFHDAAIAAKAPYDMILMNILAEPLVRLARDAVAHLAPEGLLILSGILRWQETTILEAYTGLGLTLLHRLSQDDWVCLVMEKQP